MLAVFPLFLSSVRSNAAANSYADVNGLVRTRLEQLLELPFDDFVLAREDGKGTELPAFVLLYLPDDHTNGTAPGKPRPVASVADIEFKDAPEGYVKIHKN